MSKGDKVMATWKRIAKQKYVKQAETPRLQIQPSSTLMISTEVLQSTGYLLEWSKSIVSPPLEDRGGMNMIPEPKYTLPMRLIGSSTHNLPIPSSKDTMVTVLRLN